MQMIDVLKRLAELDATNPAIDTGLKVVKPVNGINAVVKENVQVDECGMMPPMPSAPSTPASLSMSAASGEELSDMIRAIATLAGTAKGGDDEIVTGAPAQEPAPMQAQHPTDSMRSVIDKLNPVDDEGEDDQDDQDQDDQEETDEGLVGAGLGGLAGGKLGQMGGAALGTAVGGPIGGAIGGVAGDIAGTALGAKAGDKITGEEYDNTPNDPRDTNEFDAEQHAHHENPRGADRKGNANNPRAYDTNESIAARLMAEYQQFINEN